MSRRGTKVRLRCAGGGGGGGVRPYLAISTRAPPAARRPVAALSHGGGRNGRGARPRSSPYLVKQATHWPAGQRRARPVRAETPGRAPGLKTQPPWGRRGRGSPAGAEPRPDLLTRCTGGRRRDLCFATGQCEASPKVRSGPSSAAVEVGGPTPLAAGIENARLPRACRPGAAIAGLPEVGVSPVVKKDSV